MASSLAVHARNGSYLPHEVPCLRYAWYFVCIATDVVLEGAHSAISPADVDACHYEIPLHTIHLFGFNLAASFWNFPKFLLVASYDIYNSRFTFNTLISIDFKFMRITNLKISRGFDRE